MTQTGVAALTAVLFAAASSAAFAANDPAPAAASAPTQATATAKTAPGKVVDPDDKVVCKYDTPTGSRLGATKTCMTKRQWAEQSNGARDTMNHQFQGQGASSH
jgi:hypothetical protein